MKKLMLISLFAGSMLLLPSCNQPEDLLAPEANESSVGPGNRAPHYSEVACLIYDDEDNPVAAGVRCRSQNGGGCRRATPCVAVPYGIAFMIENEYTWGEIADEEPALEGHVDLQYALWEWDPTTYWHPDSLEQ